MTRDRTVRVTFEDDSPLTKPETVLVTDRDAKDMIQRIQITRIQELEDMDQDIGGHTLVIHYPSILVGSRVTIVSYKEA
jgi:hypothetical protein